MRRCHRMARTRYLARRPASKPGRGPVSCAPGTVGRSWTGKALSDLRSANAALLYRLRRRRTATDRARRRTPWLFLCLLAASICSLASGRPGQAGWVGQAPRHRAGRDCQKGKRYFAVPTRLVPRQARHIPSSDTSRLVPRRRSPVPPRICESLRTDLTSSAPVPPFVSLSLSRCLSPSRRRSLIRRLRRISPHASTEPRAHAYMPACLRTTLHFAWATDRVAGGACGEILKGGFPCACRHIADVLQKAVAVACCWSESDESCRCWGALPDMCRPSSPPPPPPGSTAPSNREQEKRPADPSGDRVDETRPRFPFRTPKRPSPICPPPLLPPPPPHTTTTYTTTTTTTTTTFVILRPVDGPGATHGRPLPSAGGGGGDGNDSLGGECRPHDAVENLVRGTCLILTPAAGTKEHAPRSGDILTRRQARSSTPDAQSPAPIRAICHPSTAHAQTIRLDRYPFLFSYLRHPAATLPASTKATTANRVALTPRPPRHREVFESVEDVETEPSGRAVARGCRNPPAAQESWPCIEPVPRDSAASALVQPRDSARARPPR
ncbi:hypothetical protein CDD83_7564 [Cordyceps sp. RAO-2017]|nr:hypothetical protein CDD83_7564 [Cordyceps sp. RAO-2017]